MGHKFCLSICSIYVCLLVPAACAQAPAKGLNPAIQKVVDGISEERIIEILKKLESFGTRNIFSEQDNPNRGVGAARDWIAGQFKSYSPRLKVSLYRYTIKKQQRVFRDVQIANVVAYLPGKINSDRFLIVSGHYDSLHIVTKPRAPGQSTSTDGVPNEAPEYDNEKTVAADAPGVTDDASGVAAVMEMARVMSQYEFDNSILFVAFAGEEYGLLGSRAAAARAKAEKRIVDAVLNNDIIGSTAGGDGKIGNTTVNVYSAEPQDSPSRDLARYVKTMAGRYVPSMNVEMVYREDRMGRGGDHTPFSRAGFAAVRLSTPIENYANQHTGTDTFANTSPSYITAVTKVNAAALASLALAPKPPNVMREIQTGTYKGTLTPNISRGKSRYDAVLRWKNDKPEPDLAGYSVLIRSTLSPTWEREIFVGNVTEFTMKDLSIDDLVFGVKAIDRDGNESLVSTYIYLPRPLTPLETN
jgi:hypothetical protein